MRRDREHEEQGNQEQEPTLVDPGEAVRRAREEHQKAPTDESTTDVDEVRESGFGA